MLVRVLVAIEEEYRAYRMIAETFKALRPGLEVWDCDMEEIERYTQRLRPDVVVCGRQNLGEPGDQFAWVELSLEPPFPSKICVGGRIAERLNPGLEDLLSVIDEVEEFHRSAIA